MAYVGTSSADIGGGGKTTTEINLSACLARKRKETLLIDFTHQGNATYGLGIRPPKKTLWHVFCKGVPLEEILVQPYPEELPDLWVAPSDASLYEVARTHDYHKDPYLLARAIASVWHKFAHIRIDTPGTALGFYPEVVYAACDTVIITIRASAFDLKGAKTLVASVNRIKETVNPRLRILRVLVTQWRKTTVAERVLSALNLVYSGGGEDQALSEAIKNTFEGTMRTPLFKTRVRFTDAHKTDQVLGKPAILTRNYRGAQDYEAITNEYLTLCAMRAPGTLKVS